MVGESNYLLGLREIKMNIRVSIFLLFLSVALECNSSVDINVCETGGEAASNGKYKLAISELNKCLAIASLDLGLRSRAYRARAWAHFNLHNDAMAVKDQEVAFKLVKPKDYHEFINYASYLRRVQRYEDSLAPLYAAIAIDEKHSRVWMMTLYNLGWSLQELGKYEESIEAFNKGIPAQPDFPFVYWRRGLSYHALGKKVEAKKDFQEYKVQLEKSKMEVPALWKQKIMDMLLLYKLEK